MLITRNPIVYLKDNFVASAQKNPWVGPEIELYPRPVPGENGKFLPLNETPNAKRQIDNFQPRVHLVVQRRKITSKNVEEIEVCQNIYSYWAVS